MVLRSTKKSRKEGSSMGWGEKFSGSKQFKKNED